MMIMQGEAALSLYDLVTQKDEDSDVWPQA